MLDLSKPVQTRDGKPWQFWMWDEGTPKRMLGAYFENGRWHCRDWTPDGKLPAGVDYHPIELVNVPQKVKVEGWMNVYRGNDGATWGSIWESKERASRATKDSGRIACVRIDLEVTEGEGLE